MAQVRQFPHEDFGDRYAIERELGHGATATVYLARDLKFEDKLVAIKVLSEHFALPVPRERFLREIQTTAKLNHPHIVTLMESGTTRGRLRRPFYVMRFIDGETLRDLLARGPLAVDVALRVARQGASALGHAHRHGVIHRDIKPGNIMIEDGHTWVTDFGIARAMAATDGQTVTSTGVTIGTPAYMSPEQAMGRGDLDARSDIYSLGCVLYEMLAGRMPFDGPDVQVILNKHLAEPLPPLREFRPDVPERVERLLDLALAKKPDQRFLTAADFADALSLEGAGPLTPTRTQPVRGERRTGISWKPRAVAVASATFALGLLVMVAWALSRQTLKSDRYLIIPGWEYGEGVSSSMNADRLLRDQLNEWKGITVMGSSDSASPRRPGAAARQAQAAWYIRGGVSRVGDSLRVRAQLYGTRRDSLVRERAANLDPSMIGADPAFKRLVDQLVFDDTVWAANGGRAGTISLAARHAFARGLTAVQTWNLSDADSAFRQATDADPSYSQAHLWVAQVRFWGDGAPATWRSAAERAASDSVRLSGRHRLLAAALRDFGRGEVVQACQTWDRLTKDAPHDFVGWYGLANCISKDEAVLRDRGSRSGWRFRSSYYRATKAYERAFQLFPSIHRALSSGSFASVRRLLMTNGAQVRAGRGVPPDSTTFLAFPYWQSDTLAFAPYPRRLFDSPNVVPEGVALAVHRERELFHEIATAWATSFPQSADAIEALAISLELLSDPTALDTLRRARALATTSDARFRLAGAEVWMRVKFSVPSNPTGLLAARALADSLIQNYAASETPQPLLLASLAALTGRASLAAALTRHAGVIVEWIVPPPLAQTGGPLLAFAALGGPTDSLREYEQQVEAAITRSLPAQMQNRARMRWLGRPAALAFPIYRFESLTKVVGGGNYLVDAEAAFLRRDTGAVRRVFSDLRTARRLLPPADLTFDALYPEAWLLAALGDDAEAIAWMDPTLGALRATQPENFVDPANAGALVRAMALRAELAGRTGDSVAATRWARRVVILWSSADEFLQPVVRRMERLAPPPARVH